MRSKYTKSVEINPGDTLVLENGEEWILKDTCRYILVEENTKVLPTGNRRVNLYLQQMRIQFKANRQYRR